MKGLTRKSRVVARDPNVERDRARVYVPTKNARDTCNSPHPTVRRKVKGIVRFTTCQRYAGHPNSHRAETVPGRLLWWS